MAKILYIKANPKPESASRTMTIANSFVAAFKAKNPNDEIIALDLYKESIIFLTNDDINTLFAPKTPESRNNPLLKYAYQFAEADKYIFAEPMWNLNVPAILKAYIDYITVTGITFQYTQAGAVGILKNKKAVNIVSRGGDYQEEPHSYYEMGDKYLKTILGFYGVTDFTTISANKLDIVGEDVNTIVNNAIEQAKVVAETF